MADLVLQEKPIAIIPARGGSKRIPRKNIKPFLGKPIISYSINTALESNLFSEVMVSTDDEEIAEIAIQCGAKVPFLRSAENANDFVGTAEVLLEVIDNYKANNQEFNYGCCLYPTAPFITSHLLKEAFQKLIKNNFDVVFPIQKFPYPIQRGLRLKDEKVKMIWPKNLTKRSQDLEEYYHDCGLFYFFKTAVLMQKKKLFTSNSGAIILKEKQAQDIDTQDDWEVAEFKYKLFHKK